MPRDNTLLTLSFNMGSVNLYSRVKRFAVAPCTLYSELSVFVVEFMYSPRAVTFRQRRELHQILWSPMLCKFIYCVFMIEEMLNYHSAEASVLVNYDYWVFWHYYFSRGFVPFVSIFRIFGIPVRSLASMCASWVFLRLMLARWCLDPFLFKLALIHVSTCMLDPDQIYIYAFLNMSVPTCLDPDIIKYNLTCLKRHLSLWRL